MKNGVIVFLMLASISVFASEEISGKVKSVIDGNTLEILDENNQVQLVLLAGIDSPELNQKFGGIAKSFVEDLVLDKKVTFTITGKDRWGKPLAIVLLKGKTDIRVEILKEGLAWTAERNPLQELETVRASAQENSKGLWSQENPTPPWVYRRQQTMVQAKES